ncbi:hypothetical protein ES703_123836 [subsurface metagenome]
MVPGLIRRSVTSASSSGARKNVAFSISGLSMSGFSMPRLSMSGLSISGAIISAGVMLTSSSKWGVVFNLHPSLRTEILAEGV